MSNVIRVIKSRRKRWVGHVARRGAKMNAYRVDVGGKIILKCILEK
jgi:hypothetical protein